MSCGNQIPWYPSGMSNTNTISADSIQGETIAQKRANLVLIMREAAYLNAVDGDDRAAEAAAYIRFHQAHLAVQRAYGRKAA
jgi:hypothetical protein